VKPYARILLSLFTCTLVLAGAVTVNRLAIPDRNTSATRFDTLIVLGYPANADGSPSPEQRERVLEAVREYKAGVAPNLIMTGGPAHNQFIEAHVMAALAERQGIPESAIVEEPKAQNTIQNIYYSSEIMRARNWHTAEVVSSPSHLGRAAMILQAFARPKPSAAFEWRTHRSLWPAEYSLLRRLSLDTLEAARCFKIRLFGFPKSRFLP
jgi:uncharacterized SAM-binding protein YcdF (DUF218 family)